MNKAQHGFLVKNVAYF